MCVFGRARGIMILSVGFNTGYINPFMSRKWYQKGLGIWNFGWMSGGGKGSLIILDCLVQGHGMRPVTLGRTSLLQLQWICTSVVVMLSRHCAPGLGCHAPSQQSYFTTRISYIASTPERSFLPHFYFFKILWIVGLNFNREIYL